MNSASIDYREDAQAMDSRIDLVSGNGGHGQSNQSGQRDEILVAGAAVATGSGYAQAMSVVVGSVADMANFAVTLVHGPGWDDARPIRKQDDWDAHAAFMDGLVDDGFLIVGGPLGAGDRTMHLIEAEDELEIRARFGEDPWAATDLLRVGSVEPWTLWLDGRHRVA